MSAVILTLNEETNIERCVQSLAPGVTDIHVLDSGSTDGTVARAMRLGAKVQTRVPPSPFMITEQRNWALDNLPLRNDWILFLDADEEATEPFLAAVHSLVLETDADAVYCAPQFMYQGTWLRRFKGYPNWHPRLMRRSVVRLEGGVWEEFADNPRTDQLAVPYIHFVDSKGFDDWIGRHLRYARWESSLAEPVQGDDPRRSILRRVAAWSGPWRPLMSLAYHAVVRRGVLYGGSVFSYMRRQLMYELAIVEYRRERDLEARRAPGSRTSP